MPDSSAQPAAATRRSDLLSHLALAALSLLVYAPSLGYGFVWDDFDYLLGNARVQGLTAAHWRAIWLEPFAGLYSPVHHSAVALLHQVAGLTPWPFHAAQVALHAACAGLLFAVLRRLESASVALISAALFAVHPANIENVAWISEMKSTLAFCLCLLSLLMFLRHGRTQRAMDAASCVALFALALLAKPSVITAPAMLLLLTAVPEYRGGRRPRAQCWLAGMLLLLSLGMGLATLKLQLSSPGADQAARLALATILAPGEAPLPGIGGYYGGWAVHLLNVPGFLWFYVKTLLWPAQLSAWQMFSVETAWTARLGLQWAALLVALAAVARAWFSRSGRAWAFWAMWFLMFLLPVLQLTPNYIWVADRYLYIPAVGAFVLLGKLNMALASRGGSARPRRAARVLPVLAVLALSWMAARHLPVWRSDATLWPAAMSTCYRSAYCHDMLALAQVRGAEKASSAEEAARLRQSAIEEASLSVDMAPTPERYIYLGQALTAARDPRAFDAFRKAQEMLGQMPTAYWAEIIKAHYRFGDLAEAERLLALLEATRAENASLLMVRAFIRWKQSRNTEARAAITRLMNLNPLAPRGPRGTEQFVSHYWGDRAEAQRMLRGIGLGVAP